MILLSKFNLRFTTLQTLFTCELQSKFVCRYAHLVIFHKLTQVPGHYLRQLFIHHNFCGIAIS